MKKVTKPLILALAAFAFVVTGCKGKKDASDEKPKGEELVTVYCSGSEYFTNREFFRANAIGESMDQMTAKRKAMSAAREELANNMETTMSVVVDDHVQSSEFNNKEEITEVFNTLARTSTRQTLRGVRTICEKQTRTAEGRYKTYIAVELSADDLLTDYNERLSNDERIRAEYNYDRFKETFEKEMEKYEQNQ